MRQPGHVTGVWTQTPVPRFNFLAVFAPLEVRGGDMGRAGGDSTREGR